jgi:hypothetical protein
MPRGAFALGEAETEEETGADNVEPVPEHQPQVAAAR